MPGSMEAVAVFDVGKTNVKLVAISKEGRILETLSRPNPVFPGPPYAHHDLALIEEWLLSSLNRLSARHSITAIVATGHGSGGVLVDKDGPLMPMMDYEQDPPDHIADDYPLLAGSFRERGSPCMLASAHLAKQMLWLERGWPEQFARGEAYLAHPQYWAWRLSGVMASEVTSLAAQSHLWCALDSRYTDLVVSHGWQRLIPPFAPAWQMLGTLREEIARVTGLSTDVQVLNGIHDSSANLYRYQAGGFKDLTVVSTGTWIASISDKTGLSFDVEQPGLCCNADVEGHPLPGMLVMGGREFDAVAGGNPGPASVDVLDRLIATQTMALPCFGSDDALFPGTCRRGEIVGSLSEDKASRFTLAVFYTALLTNCCIDMLGSPTIILDGTFVRDPLYGSIIAALQVDRSIFVSREPSGTVAGAALLATHRSRTSPVMLEMERPAPVRNSSLIDYARTWHNLANKRKNQ